MYIYVYIAIKNSETRNLVNNS